MRYFSSNLKNNVNSEYQVSNCPQRFHAFHVHQILIVEDDNSTQQYLKTIIRSAFESSRIIAFSNGEDAIWYLEYLLRERERGPCLAFIDIFLRGEKSGFDICRYIAGYFPETKSIVTSSMHPNSFYDKFGDSEERPLFFHKPIEFRKMIHFLRATVMP